MASTDSIDQGIVHPSFQSLRERVISRMEELQLPSVSISVTKGEDLLWEESFGYADRERKMRATPCTMYSLASISKPITATAIMKLVEQGKIDLDWPANEYLGDAKIESRRFDANGVTIRRLLDHTSGLSTHFQFYYEDEKRVPPHRDETIRRYAHLLAAPGERFQYCNLGYGLLDHIIERVSGKTYEEYLTSEIFQPLGLDQMAVNISERFKGLEAVRYGRDGVPYPFYDNDHPGASSVYSSAKSLIKFGKMHLISPDMPTILSRESISEMQIGTAEMSPISKYGLGWRIGDNDFGHRVVEHNGAMGGVSTVLRLVPKEQIAVVVLCNSRSSDLTSDTADDIFGVLLPGYAEGLAERRAKQTIEQPKPSESAPEELLGEWKGEAYVLGNTVSLRLHVSNGSAVMCAGGGKSCPVEDLKISDGGWVSGVTDIALGSADADRLPHRVHLDLRLREGRLLTGGVRTVSETGEDGGAPGKRLGNCLAYYCELRSNA